MSQEMLLWGILLPLTVLNLICVFVAVKISITTTYDLGPKDRRITVAFLLLFSLLLDIAVTVYMYNLLRMFE